MVFPKFDLKDIKFQANTLEGWIRSLPQDAVLRVLHTNNEGLEVTWVEWKEGNVLFCVSETKK